MFFFQGWNYFMLTGCFLPPLARMLFNFKCKEFLFKDFSPSSCFICSQNR